MHLIVIREASNPTPKCWSKFCCLFFLASLWQSTFWQWFHGCIFSGLASVYVCILNVCSYKVSRYLRPVPTLVLVSHLHYHVKNLNSKGILRGDQNWWWSFSELILEGYSSAYNSHDEEKYLTLSSTYRSYGRKFGIAPKSWGRYFLVLGKVFPAISWRFRFISSKHGCQDSIHVTFQTNWNFRTYRSLHALLLTTFQAHSLPFLSRV